MEEAFPEAHDVGMRELGQQSGLFAGLYHVFFVFRWVCAREGVHGSVSGARRDETHGGPKEKEK